LRNLFLALLILCIASLVTIRGFTAQGVSIEDIPRIVEAGNARFEKDYKGKLYTAKMSVNDVLDRTTFYAIGFNINGEQKTFPPISCRIEDLNEARLASGGKILWVSGILDNLLGSTIFLYPCEISVTQEPWVVPKPWKTKPPRQ
jgi:hypothetical protein